jgi:hypothetical protein|nr:hypothetical protein [uncultured Rhodopila sp.]
MAAQYTQFRVTYNTFRDDKNASTQLQTDIVRRSDGSAVASATTIDAHFEDPSSHSVSLTVPGNTPIYVSDIKSYGIHIQIQAGKDDWYFYFKVEGYNTDSNQWDTIPGYENHICDDYHHTGGLHTEDNQPDGLRDWF